MREKIGFHATGAKRGKMVVKQVRPVFVLPLIC